MKRTLSAKTQSFSNSYRVILPMGRPQDFPGVGFRPPAGSKNGAPMDVWGEASRS